MRLMKYGNLLRALEGICQGSAFIFRIEKKCTRSLRWWHPNDAIPSQMALGEPAYPRLFVHRHFTTAFSQFLAFLAMKYLHDYLRFLLLLMICFLKWKQKYMCVWTTWPQLAWLCQAHLPGLPGRSSAAPGWASPSLGCSLEPPLRSPHLSLQQAARARSHDNETSLVSHLLSSRKEVTWLGLESEGGQQSYLAKGVDTGGWQTGALLQPITTLKCIYF